MLVTIKTSATTIFERELNSSLKEQLEVLYIPPKITLSIGTMKGIDSIISIFSNNVGKNIQLFLNSNFIIEMPLNQVGLITPESGDKAIVSLRSKV